MLIIIMIIMKFILQGQDKETGRWMVFYQQKQEQDICK